MFKKLFGRREGKQAGGYDPGELQDGATQNDRALQRPPIYGHATMEGVLRHMERGNYIPLKRMLAKAPYGGFSRSNMLDLAEEVDHDQPSLWVVNWVRDEPENPVAVSAYGWMQLLVGWNARGDGGVETVTPAGWKTFYECLRLSSQTLQHAIQLDPRDVLPWEYLMLGARGTRVDLPTAERIFNEILQRDPESPRGHYAMHLYLCNKWFGSHEQMFAFAHSVSEGAPAGSVLHGLVPAAHSEMWIDLEGEEAENYYLRPEVKQSINAAYRRFSAATGDDSVDRVQAANEFAFGLNYTHQWDELTDVFQYLGAYKADRPWYYAHDPDGAFREALENSGVL